VAAAGQAGGHIDPRLYAGPSGASEGVPSDGGFLVRHDYSTQLLDRSIEEAVLAPLCTEVEVGEDADGVDMPYINETSRANGSRWGGVQVYWRAEADTVTATRPKFDLHDLRLQELMGLAYATDRLLRDATALESIFSMAFASEMAFKLDDAIFRGNGAGLPLGFSSSTGPRVQQAKETGQAADTIVSENISKMWTRVLPRSKGRGVWFYNSEVSEQFDGLYYPAGTAGIPTRVVSYDESGVARIKGRPAIEIEQAAALGDEGDLVFADLSRYVLIRKGGLMPAQSMHVRFLYGENTFRWTIRVNGMPIDKSAITPYKGSATQSAFVTLADRA
jgi:HK97 family phage major capsid protein